jgi:membrane-bound lytic murein transglycosylase A
MAAIGILLLLLLGVPPGTACGETVPPAIVDDMDPGSLRVALRRSLEFLRRVPAERVLGEWPRGITAGEIQESLVLFLNGLDSFYDSRAFEAWVHSSFELLPAAQVLFTGYYRPVVQAHRSASGRYRFPVYGKPKDLIEAEVVTLTPQRRVERIVGRMEGERWLPYFSRLEIDRDGRLAGKGYEIAWLDDPVELFFLHVQGSGVLRLADGEIVSVSYAASNGRPYRSIGKILVDRGELPMEEVTMQRLKRYLNDFPEKRLALLNQNERYVFFRVNKEGALGSLGVPLTPGRSIATDARLFPKGALALMMAEKPALNSGGNLTGWQAFSRFVVNQDTGAALQGPRRVDLYFGDGDRAGEAAGVMKSTGRLFWLVKRKPHNPEPQ